jgi:hypothetical protein
MRVVLLGVAGVLLGLAIQHLRNPVLKQRLKTRLHWESEGRFDTITLILAYLAAGIALYAIVQTYYSKQTIEQNLRALNPYHQPIGAFTATMQLFVKSDKEINRRFSRGGVSLVFTKGQDHLLWARSDQYLAVQTGSGQIRFSSDLTMIGNSPARGQPVSILRDIDSVKLIFSAMGTGNSRIEMNNEILHGRIICNINNVIPLAFPIPSQRVQGAEISIPDIDKVLQALNL